MEDRKEFLLRMYDQLWNNINRHILVVWQSVGVLVGIFAVFSLVEKKIISIDIASTLIILISSWLIAHVIDASLWVNRNLAIITNIERQFLKEEDLRNIHYFFGERPKKDMLDHLQIQFWLGILIAGIVLAYHLINRVLPGIGSPISNFKVERSLPYIVLIPCIILLFKLYRKNIKRFEEFLKNSPGIKINTSERDSGELD